MPIKSHPDDGREQHEDALMNTVDVAPLLKQLIVGNTAVRTELSRGISTNAHYWYSVPPAQAEAYAPGARAYMHEALLDYREKNHVEYGAPIFSFEYDNSSDKNTDINQDASTHGILSVIPGIATISIESFSRAAEAGGHVRYGVTIETPSRTVHLDFETANRDAVRALHTAFIEKIYSHPLDTMAGITEAVAFWSNADLNPYSANALIEKDNRKK